MKTDLIVKDNFNNSIYSVSIGAIEKNYFILELNLLCGYDYINRDENDIQGYISSDNFSNDVQYYEHVCYFLDESVKECLEENGYTILKNLPKIHI